jgi:hypothetical protein
MMVLTEKTKQKLLTTLLEWVESSRMNNHLQDKDRLITFLNDIILVDLSAMSEPYQEKHICENLRKYSNALLVNITPHLKIWCKENKLSTMVFRFRFICNTLMFNTNHLVSVKIDNVQYREYLQNRST